MDVVHLQGVGVEQRASASHQGCPRPRRARQPRFPQTVAPVYVVRRSGRSGCRLNIEQSLRLVGSGVQRVAGGPVAVRVYLLPGPIPVKIGRTCGGPAAGRSLRSPGPRPESSRASGADKLGHDKGIFSCPLLPHGADPFPLFQAMEHGRSIQAGRLTRRGRGLIFTQPPEIRLSGAGPEEGR